MISRRRRRILFVYHWNNIWHLRMHYYVVEFFHWWKINQSNSLVSSTIRTRLVWGKKFLLTKTIENQQKKVLTCHFLSEIIFSRGTFFSSCHLLALYKQSIQFDYSHKKSSNEENFEYDSNWNGCKRNHLTKIDWKISQFKWSRTNQSVSTETTSLSWRNFFFIRYFVW